ncbi:MAG: type II 3-dehydroquinate dehydratase [Syntrophomonadaceae bacterium]|jgi:3-dehydroquinate dehydratase-2
MPKSTKMPVKIAVINGPNLNLLGVREPELYGYKSLSDINHELSGLYSGQAELEFFQSNHEGTLVDFIQNTRGKYDWIIINAGAYSHNSIAIHDALLAAGIPSIEVHVTNIYQREDFRQKSLISKVAVAGVFGFGWLGYKIAIDAAINMADRINTNER